MWQKLRSQVLILLRIQTHLSFLCAVRTIAESAYRLLHVRPSVRMYQRGSHWAGFSEIWYWGNYMTICHETPNLVNTGRTYRALYTFLAFHFMSIISEKLQLGSWNLAGDRSHNMHTYILCIIKYPLYVDMRVLTMRKSEVISDLSHTCRICIT